MKRITLPLLVIATLFATGCTTINSRIEEKAAIFNALPPEAQARIRQGLIDVGFTPDMVYIAMGKPDNIRESTTADGNETIWVYNNYYREYEGSQFVGYRRQVYFDQRAKAYRVFYEPVHADFYRDEVEETARVVFRNGQVAVIEQQQPNP